MEEGSPFTPLNIDGLNGVLKVRVLLDPLARQWLLQQFKAQRTVPGLVYVDQVWPGFELRRTLETPTYRYDDMTCLTAPREEASHDGPLTSSYKSVNIVNREEAIKRNDFTMRCS